MLEVIFCNRFKDIASLWTAKLKECHEIKAIYKYLKLDEVTKRSLKIGVREFKQSWASTRKWSKN